MMMMMMMMIMMITSPLHESCLRWIHDPYPNQSHRVEPRKTGII